MMRVLLVEDEALLRTALEHLLRRAGFEVQAVSDAQAALATQPDFVPDLLITDWLLQGDCDGVDLGRRLRAHRPALPVVIITGLLASEARPDLDTPTAKSVLLEKPFLFAELLATIERISS